MVLTYGEGLYGNGAGVVTPLDHRMAQITEFTKTTTPNLIRSGLLYNGTSTIVSGTAGMSYDVAPFSAVSSRGATSGVVKFANDATANVVTTAAPGSNSRYDVVYAWPRDYAIDGVDSDPVLGVEQGTAAASPTVPSLSAYPGAIELARILVPAGVTATNSGTTITQTAPFTSVDGGTLVFRTTTEMNAYTPLRAGSLAWCLADSILYRWSGSAWAPWEKGETSWTPTLQNFNALGTGGAATGFYSISGGHVDWWLKISFGSGVAAPSLGWGFTPPVALRVALDDWNQKIGDGIFRDASTGNTTAGGNADLTAIYDPALGFASFRQPYSGSAVVSDYGYLSASQTGIPTLQNGDYLTARGRYAA